MTQKHQLHADLMASQASFNDATKQLDHSLKNTENDRTRTLEFSDRKIF